MCKNKTGILLVLKTLTKCHLLLESQPFFPAQTARTSEEDKSCDSSISSSHSHYSYSKGILYFVWKLGFIGKIC